MQFSCPSCGGPVTFRSRFTPYAVCPHCRNLLVRRDVSLAAMGVAAELPYDLSPFQIGTTGVYDGVRFELIGRVKVAWEKGLWNEWYVGLADERRGWLAEAQGLLMMLFEVADVTPPPFDDLAPAQEVRLGKETYRVVDKKVIHYLGCEGELPFAFVKGQEGRSADLSAPGARLASCSYFAGEPAQVFAGRYVEFDELRFEHLRELEGWSRR